MNMGPRALWVGVVCLLLLVLPAREFAAPAGNFTDAPDDFAAVAGDFAAAPDDFAAVAGDFAATDRYVMQEMQSASIPGLAYAVVADGKVLHLGAFGSTGAGNQPVTVQTPFAIGSVHKSITALAVQQLAQLGKINLDAPVQQYLPGFRAADIQASAKITVLHLLEHRSGFSTAVGNDPAFFREWLSSDELVRALASVPLSFEPGTAYAYSNLNYWVLGALIEAVARMPYEQYVQTRIYAPLGMSRSFFSVSEARQHGLAQGHRIVFGWPVIAQESFIRAMSAAGESSFSSIQDMAYYLAALTGGGRYLNTQVLNQALPGTFYDLSWVRHEKYQPYDGYGQAGATLTYKSMLFLMPGQKLGVIVLTNANPQNAWPGAKSAESIAIGATYTYLAAPGLHLPSAPAIGEVYRIFNALLLVILVGLGLHALRLVGWRTRASQSRGRSVVISLALADFILPALILLVMPYLLTRVGGAAEANPITAWGRLFNGLPDISAVLVFTAISLLVMGVVKLAWLLPMGKAMGDQGTQSSVLGF